jgi:hypothetical protein
MVAPGLGKETKTMSATTGGNSSELRVQLSKVEQAASKLIDRLSDRAAYASHEEFQEIRGLIKALRALAGK